MAYVWLEDSADFKEAVVDALVDYYEKADAHAVERFRLYNAYGRLLLRSDLAIRWSMRWLPPKPQDASDPGFVAPRPVHHHL